MIFKKKKLDFRLNKYLTIYIKKLVFFLGVISLLLGLLVSTYYYSSGLSRVYTPAALIMKVNDKVINKYIGLDLRNFFDYIEIVKLNLLSNFISNQLDNVYLEIDQESILGLELQRKIKSEQGGSISDEEKVYVPAKITFKNKDYKIKMRTKGTRQIHWNNKDTTSYKIDMIGDKRLWYMEEFSFQKPITRNYTYEYLFHNLLGHVGLIKINYFFINLYLNDQNLGIYAVEESFSKELIERQKKRNGPILSLKEEVGEYFPNIKYEMYSENYWTNNYPELTRKVFSILNNLRSKNFNINNHFDVDKWAKYFAIMDLTGAYHGSLIKSVKLFYNPVTGLFEPIGYDLHKGAGVFNNFILADFLQEENKSNKILCSYICLHKEWYLKFFKLDDGQINSEFVEKYIEYLKEYSDEGFVDNFISLFNKELSVYNNAIYKDYSKTDRVNWIGAGFFVYDDDYIYERAKLIRNKIKSSNLKYVEISKSNNQIFFEDYEGSNFPFFANTIDCENPLDEKNFFLTGKMSFNLETTCKKIKISSYGGKSKILSLNENIRITPDQNFFFKNSFKNLSLNNNFDKISDNKYLANKDILIKEDSIINANEIFIIDKLISINITNNSTLYIEGQISFINDKENLTQIYSTDGSGSIIFSNNEYNFQNIIFKNLSKPFLNSHILYGGVNFINSKISLDNIYLTDSNNEDGINIINSNTKLSNINFKNIKADALDIDFGKLNFSNIYCINVNNDCLDISGAKVEGQKLFVKNVLDKGISVGENSTVFINDLQIIKSNIALTVKDGSKAFFKDVHLEKNNFDVALFNKKNEFSKPSLKLENINFLNIEKILQSKDTEFIVDNKKLISDLSDNFINNKIY